MNPALHQRPRFLTPGDKLGSYELIRPLAVGRMAELYLARTVGSEGLETLVVVKRILPQYVDDPGVANRFLDEARLATQLQHPNIARVYDLGVEQGEPFCAMEYVHGEELGRLNATALENGCPMSLDASLTLVAGLCAGLHHAHEARGADGAPLGIVHRDVSPSNVLVSYDGEIKLVDFGLARASAHVTTPALAPEGPIAYRSPEQCGGRVALDRRSDLFSVGTILYELTTGQLPFPDATGDALRDRIITTDAPRPSTLVPSYPPALEAIVMRALARDPAQRYASARVLQGHLEDFARESRLRVSPLVLARLLSTLFPARLEEWEHARKQGAFFVEQHVLQTLSDDRSADGAAADHEPTGIEAASPIPDDLEPTDVRIPTAFPVAEPWVPLPPAPRAPLPLPPTPTPVPHRASPVPGFPNGVPIIAAFSTPVPGTLVGHAGERPGAAAIGEVTEHVRIRMPRGRSRAPVVAVVVIAVGLLGGVVFAVTRDGATRGEPAPIDPTISGTTPPRPEVAEPAAKAIDRPRDALDAASAQAVETDAAIALPSARPDPAKPVAKQPPKRPRPTRASVKPTVKPTPIKPSPAQPSPAQKDPTWNADSPFMPVRPAKR